MLHLCRELDSFRARNRALTQQAIDLQRTGPSQAVPLPVSFPSSAAATQEAARSAGAVQEAEGRASQAEAEASSLRQQLQKRSGECICRLLELRSQMFAIFKKVELTIGIISLQWRAGIEAR